MAPADFNCLSIAPLPAYAGGIKPSRLAMIRFLQ
jgi:hypothetical protein